MKWVKLKRCTLIYWMMYSLLISMSFISLSWPILEARAEILTISLFFLENLRHHDFPQRLSEKKTILPYHSFSENAYCNASPWGIVSTIGGGSGIAILICLFKYCCRINSEDDDPSVNVRARTGNVHLHIFRYHSYIT